MIEKKTFDILLILLIIGVTGCSDSPGEKEEPKIKVGVGETIITPPVGQEMWGFDRGENTATGTHDELHSRSIVVEGEDGNAVVMMTVAVGNMSEDLMDMIRNGIEERTGIPFENIVISCTHTHSGPTIGPSDSNYGKFFINRNIESAVQAWKTRIPGKIGVGTTEVFGLGLKRAALGHGGIHPDPEVAIIKIEDASGKPLGIFFNYGAHPATLDLHNLKFTEDWPYFSIKGIKDKINQDVIVGYFQAASGDINTGYSAELSAVGAEMSGARSFGQAEKKGKIMTNAVLDALPSIETSGDLKVRATYAHFDFPRRTTYPYTHSEAMRWKKDANVKLAEMEKLEGIKIGSRKLDGYRVDSWLANQAVERSWSIEKQPRNPSPHRMPLQAIRLGDVIFATFPNEVYSEIGLAVKKKSPFENTFIFALAGGHEGYIPTAEEYLEGGYVANGSPFAPDTGQVLIDSSIELISKLKD
jgi:hypothetical protein